jgi:hypothetical protein
MERWEAHEAVKCRDAPEAYPASSGRVASAPSTGLNPHWQRMWTPGGDP